MDQTFSIAKALLTITASDRSKLYGQTLSLGTTAFSTLGLVDSDGVDGVTLTSAGAAAGAAAGTYPIVPSAAVAAAGTDLSNYSITYANGTLTVRQAGIVGLQSLVDQDHRRGRRQLRLLARPVRRVEHGQRGVGGEQRRRPAQGGRGLG